MKIAFNVIGIFFFFFFFWKRIREDYTPNQIFTTAFIILLSMGIFLLLSFNFFSDWWFWAAILGYLVGIFLGIMKFKLKITETLEAGNVALIPWLSLVFFNHALASSNLSSLIFFLVLILLLIGFTLLDKHYKRFSWYKSGRVGFSGFTITGAMFLARAVAVSLYPSLLTSIGRFDFLLSAVASFAFFLLVYNLSKS